MRTYELVLVVQPGLDEEGLDAFLTTLTGFVTDAGGQIVDVEHMGRRRMAYPIKKATEAHYVLLHLNLENSALVETERRIKLSEEVLRHLVIRMDELMEPAPAQEPEPLEASEEAEAVDETAGDSVAEDAVDADAFVEDLEADDLAAELADELAEDESES
ncbi:MAG: 30S ribosomal protein S6 [Anaerolineae bacterium]